MPDHRAPRVLASSVVVALVVALVASSCTAAGRQHASSPTSQHSPARAPANAVTTGARPVTAAGVKATVETEAALAAAGGTPNAALVAAALRLPADCIPQNGPQIQMGVLATFTAHFVVGSEIASNITGSLCGIGRLIAPPPGACPPGIPAAVSLTVPADGQNFQPDVEITIIPGVTPQLPHVKVATRPITAIVCESQQTGAIHVKLTIPVSASDSFFGTDCAIGPLVIPLTGSIFGPLSGFTAIMTASFGIPASAPSPLCPEELTRNINQIFQFPTGAHAAQLSLTAHGLAYCNLPDSNVCEA